MILNREATEVSETKSRKFSGKSLIKQPLQLNKIATDLLFLQYIKTWPTWFFFECSSYEVSSAKLFQFLHFHKETEVTISPPNIYNHKSLLRV